MTVAVLAAGDGVFFVVQVAVADCPHAGVALIVPRNVATFGVAGVVQAGRSLVRPLAAAGSAA